MSLIRRVGPAVTVAVLAFAAARAAMLPGVAYWDTAELQAVGPLMGTAHPAGFPTYVLLGWLASVLLQPFGEPAFRMNLLAGLCLALAAGVTVDLVRALTRSTILGVAVGMGLALTPVAWSIGTHAETHALHLALLAIVLRLLVAWEAHTTGAADGAADRYLVATAIAFGLSVGNHSLTLLLIPPVVLFVLAIDRELLHRSSFLALCVGSFVATVALVYLELPLRAGPFRAALVYGRPETWDGFWYVVLGEQFRSSVIDPFGDLPGKVAMLVDRAVTQFGPLTPLIPLAFAATVARRPRYALLTGTTVVITCFFAASYVNAEIGRYYVGPVLLAWTWLALLARFAGDAVEAALQRITQRQPDWPAALPAVAMLIVLLTPTLRTLTDRFEAIDESHDREAAAWVDRALTVMEPDAVLVSWWSYSTPLWYAQRVEGRRPDITIIDDRTRLDENLGGITDVIDTHLGSEPVYVIRDDEREVELLANRYELAPIGGLDATSLTRVIRLRDGS